MCGNLITAALALILLAGPAASAAGPEALAKARRLYFSGDVLKSAEAFEAAVKISSTDAEAWLDGAVAWAEAGRPEKAVAFNRKAFALSASPQTRAALGWSLLRLGKNNEAEEAFAAALALSPDDAEATLGMGRAKLALNHPAEAASLLARAPAFAPQQTLADFYLGRAHEALGDEQAAAEDYRRAVVSDSSFHEGRNPLARSYLRQKRYNDAWRQLSRLAEAEPSAKLTRALIDKIRPLLTGAAEPALLVKPGPVDAPKTDSESAAKRRPLIRVGIATTPMGRPRARVSVVIRGSGDWKASDPKTKRTLADAQAQQSWTVRIVIGRKKGKNRLELRGPEGEVRAVPGDLLVLTPSDPAKSVLSIEDGPAVGGNGRSLRGVLEISLFNRRRSLRLVNIVDLEDYTQGVVGAEMPPNSPFEALKTQALIARTHALFIKTVTRRHKKEGYDVCDEQHCQVYSGLRAETERTRAAVAATRGLLARYRGALAHVIYSSNCGGWTQNGVDIGWGNVPYWTRACDAPRACGLPDSPMRLRHLLNAWPEAFCRPSGYVHASHSRWARVIGARELEEKLGRKFKIGRLMGLRVLRRAPTGHVSALLVLGSKRNAKLKDEMDIRSLLGVGSLRSTLFVVDTEYRLEKSPRSKTVLTPQAFVFRGGGWGHCVGLCQSGAIGRAEAGQDFATIVKAYFPGIVLSRLED